MKKEYTQEEIEALVLESLGDITDDEDESTETTVVIQVNQKPKTVKRPGKKN